MTQCASLIVLCLVAGIAGLTCEIAESNAAPAKLSQAVIDAKAHAVKKAFLQRRQDAKKHFKEALEARKAQRLADKGIMAPDNSGKGGTE